MLISRNHEKMSTAFCLGTFAFFLFTEIKTFIENHYFNSFVTHIAPFRKHLTISQIVRPKICQLSEVNSSVDGSNGSI